MTPGKLSSALDPATATRMLFDEHAPMVLALCRAVLRDRHEADDAVQETFLAAHRALLSGHEPRRPAGWLAAIARNECRARIRRRAAAPVPVALAEAPASTDAAEVVDAREELNWLTDQINALPARQRETLVLHELRGLSQEEIAEEVGVSQGVVRGLLARARSRLRKGRPVIPAPVLLDPAGIREQLARVLPGFEPAAAGTGAAGIAWAPIAAKLAVASAGLATLAPAAAPPAATHRAPAPPRGATRHAISAPRARPVPHRVVVVARQATPTKPVRTTHLAARAVRDESGGHEGHERASESGPSRHGHSGSPETIVSPGGPGGDVRSEQPATISPVDPSGHTGSDRSSAAVSSSGPSSPGETSAGHSGSDSSGPGPGSAVETPRVEESTSGHGSPEPEGEKGKG